jgi:hypothetical protein
MSHVTSTSGARRFQSTRRVSGGKEPDGGTQEHKETEAPKRTFGRTYLSRGFSGFHRPKRPPRTMPFGKKMWSADDELPGIPRRPQLAATTLARPREGATTASSRKFISKGCKRMGGTMSRVPTRAELTSIPMRVMTTNENEIDLETDPTEE